MSATAKQGSNKGGQGNQKKQGKGEKQKVSKKNILLTPFQNDWPRVNGDTENEILDALIEKLKDFPRLVPENERGGVNNTQSKDDDADLIRKRLRLQLALGHRQVCKSLERDELSLLLVWSEQPPILLQSLLPLVGSRGCPALCLGSLMPRVSEAFGLSSLLAVGFRKCQPELKDFESFIAKAAALAPPLDLPWLDEEIATSETASDKGDNSAKTESSGKEEGKDAFIEKIEWPVMSESQDNDVMEKLCSVLEPYKDVFKPQSIQAKRQSKNRKDMKSRRDMIRNHIVIDTHVITDAAKSGRLDLLIIQYESDFPSTATLTSAVKMAVRKGCPVLHSTTLRERLAPILRNSLLKAVGFKKPKADTVKTPAELAKFVAFAKTFTSTDLLTLLPPDDSCEKESKTDKEKKSNSESQHQKESGVSSENKESRAAQNQSKTKTPIPVYDVSHLYVYKSDETATKEGETTLSEPAAKKKKKFELSSETEMFISLNSEPTTRIVMPKGESALLELRKMKSVKGKGKKDLVKKSVGLTKSVVEEEKGEGDEMMKSVRSDGDNLSVADAKKDLGADDVSEYSEDKVTEDIKTQFVIEKSSTIPAEEQSASNTEEKSLMFVIDTSSKSEPSKTSKAVESAFVVDTSPKSQTAKMQDSMEVDDKGDDSSDNEGGNSSRIFGVMGLESANPLPESASFIPEARQPKGKAKKRKLGGGFVSFALTPTEVRTSVANPNKKRNKKKKK